MTHITTHRKRIEKGIFILGDKYYIQFSVKGKQVREAVGYVKDMTKTMVRDILAKRRVDIVTGRIESEHDIKIKKNKIRMLDLFNDYLSYQENNNSQRTYEINKNSVTSLSKHFKKLTDVNTLSFERYKREMRKKGYSFRTIDLTLQTLNSTISYAVKCNRIPEKYLRERAKLFRVNNARSDFISDDEICKILTVIEPYSYLHTFFLIGLNQGFRKSELLSVKWSNIDFVNERIILECTKTSKVPQLFHLHGETKRYLQELQLYYKEIKPNLIRERNKLEKMGALTQRQRKRLSVIKRRLLSIESDYVITTAGERLLDVRGAWKTLLQNAGVRYYRIHDLRHTYASRMLMGGATLHDLLQTGLWKGYDSLLRYAHLEGNYLKEKLNAVSMPKPNGQGALNMRKIKAN